MSSIKERREAFIREIQAPLKPPPKKAVQLPEEDEEEGDFDLLDDDIWLFEESVSEEEKLSMEEEMSRRFNALFGSAD